ncbi:MAG TPA: ATPase [Alphaproteobacteria bacterium]|nr:ATPase [Alphaproteobacteria bacterium]
MDFPSPKDVISLLGQHGYVCPEDLATSIFLASRMGRPILLEGEAGIGKTELAKALALASCSSFIRLQCYEGIESGQALYEWNHARQYMDIQLAQAHHAPIDSDQLFTKKYLLERPLLASITGQDSKVLLIDELDRADEAFEAFLLEYLAEFQITIPEFGTINADQRPLVVITSNRTRELSDALKRRCLYQWLDFPSRAREEAIISKRFPDLPDELSTAITGFVHEIRSMDLIKNPGIAESLDWAQALIALDALTLDPEIVQQSMGVLLKHQSDIEQVQQSDLQAIIRNAKRNLSN